MKFNLLAATLVILGLLPNLASAEDAAGKVIASSGDLTASKGGAKRALQRKDDIFEGDTITSGPGASAQIRMADGAILEIQPDTAFKIDHYHVDPSNNGKNEKSEMSLLKGGFKTLTGGIATRNPSFYQVNTANATMGVRGTYWGAAVCSKQGLYAGESGCPATAVEVGVWGQKLETAECANRKHGAWIHSSKKEYNIGPCDPFSFARVLPGGEIRGELSQSSLFVKGTSGGLIAQTGGGAGGGGDTTTTTNTVSPVTPVLVNNNVSAIGTPPPAFNAGTETGLVLGQNLPNSTHFVLGNASIVDFNGTGSDQMPSFSSASGAELVSTSGADQNYVQLNDNDSESINAAFGQSTLSATYQPGGVAFSNKPNNLYWYVADTANVLPNPMMGGTLNFFVVNSIAFSGENPTSTGSINASASSLSIAMNSANPAVTGTLNINDGNSGLWGVNVGGNWNGSSKTLNVNIAAGSTYNGTQSISGTIASTFINTNKTSIPLTDLGLLVGVNAATSGHTVTAGALMTQTSLCNSCGG